jgi:hypothetical protein
LDGCPACAAENADGGHCVIVAHIPAYRLGENIQDPGQADEDENEIDNLTHRHFLPSTQNITEVIRCMLEQGIAEGIPGPRGPAGEQGLAGETGERGPGIVAATATTLEPGSEATASLIPIPGDPEGDHVLRLGIPAGADGGRGPGIVAVSVATLPPGSSATAALVPIPGDPEGDQMLQLGIPRGQPGTPGPIDDPELTHITNLSWVHAGGFDSIDEWAGFVQELGLVIKFDEEFGGVQTRTLYDIVDSPNFGQVGISEVFELRVRRNTDMGMCECRLSNVFCEPVEAEVDPATGRIVNVNPLPLDIENTPAVRLMMNSDMARQVGAAFCRVVFRSDFALDMNKKAVDGNHIGGLVPERPTGNGREGGTFESWFTVGLKLEG